MKKAKLLHPSKVLIMMLSLFMVLTHVSGCANRYREAFTGYEPADISTKLNEVLARSQSAQNVSAAQVLLADEATKIYYTEAPGELGDVDVVTPFDFNIVSPNLSGYDNVDRVQIFFLVRDLPNEFAATLIIDAKPFGAAGNIVKVFNSQGAESFGPGGIYGVDNDDEFEIGLTDGQNMILVRSLDIDPENSELASTIQLSLHRLDQFGQEYQFGQISSLEGF